jgi:hypothetical protein
MSTLNKILLALLAAQLALTAFLFWPQSPAQSSDAPLLPALSADNVTGLTITDDADHTLALAKTGSDWAIPTAGNYPVLTNTVTTLLDKIAGLKTNRLVTQTEASHSRLKVSPTTFSRRIELTLADGSAATLYIGSSAGAGATHVRLDGQPEVYLTADLSAFEANAQPSGWIDTQYLTADTAAVSALTLQNANGTFEFKKEGDQWTLAGLTAAESFNPAGFNGLLNQAAALRMDSPLGQEAQASYGLDKPAATVTLTLTGETPQTVTLTVGAKTEDGYVVKSSESPYYVTVSDYVGQAFVEKTRTDFLAAPATPAAAPADIAPQN